MGIGEDPLGIKKKLKMDEAVSSNWYLAPLLFGLIGGLIAWALTHEEDNYKARGFLMLGIIVSIAWFIVIWIRYGQLLML